MSGAGTPVVDPWVIQPREKKWYEDQFKSLQPVNGIVTGDQAKGFLLQSQLPPLILGQIWALSDTDADGKMDLNEFSIACKLIHLKLRGTELPKTLPVSLVNSLKMFSPPARPQPPKMDNATAQRNMSPLIQTAVVQPMVPGPRPPSLPGTPTNLMGGGSVMAPSVVGARPTPQQVPPPVMIPPVMGSAIPPAIPPLPAMYVPPVPAAAAVSSTPRTSIDRGCSPLDLQQSEWAIPQQTKLKYTQLFNSTDRARSGYLSGVQARNVMVQSKLPQNLLAQIWALSDMDADGQLGCEEFVLAMHLCEQAAAGVLPPAALPPELVPPTFRRAPRHGSVSSQGSATSAAAAATVTSDTDHVHGMLISQASFEDKRKENFEKGQAELERRRKALLEAQRKEAEERDRKEREENERRERAKQEAERKRLKELEAQMREQEEVERQKEEERKRMAEQREAARKEMERQRQLEWEKQRSQELQQQRQREQEKVLRLKARNQTLTIELSSLNEQVKELSQKICDTRVGVSNIKTTIDGMRSTRDTQIQEMSQLKNKLKEQNARLLALSHEKVRLDAKNRQNAQQQGADPTNEQAKAAFDNKEIIIKQLKDKLEDMQAQIQGKMQDIDNNNSQLGELKRQLTTLVSECEVLYDVYEEKRVVVLGMKGATKAAATNINAAQDTWKQSEDDWPVSDWGTETAAEDVTVAAAASAAAVPSAAVPTQPGYVKYRALYEFMARNNDEVSFQPGDIVMVPLEQKGEPGWMAGEIRGHTGWFPESYVERVDFDVAPGSEADPAGVDPLAAFPDDSESKRLEGIAEVPETLSDTMSGEPSLGQSSLDKEDVVVSAPIAEAAPVEYYVASYPYQSVEQGDLSFNVGDVIAVLKKEGDWWTGKMADNVGIFPSNYVQRADNSFGEEGSASPPMAATVAVAPSPAPVAEVQRASLGDADLQQPDAGLDSEVCQINDGKVLLDKSPDFAAMSANTQTLRSGKKPEIATVIAPYQATSPEQLSLQRGQLIMVRKKTDSGWWEGELQAKGRRRQIGWFPASYVKVLSSSGRTSGRNTPVSATRMQQEVVIDKVMALFPYTANNPDELSFLKDDIISVTAREEPCWWRGELNGVSGVFPSNYVGPLQQSRGSVEDRARCDSVDELVSTERAYLDDMAAVHRVFERPLRASGVVSDQDVDAIFINWQEIVQSNRDFLQELTCRIERDNDMRIGDIVCKHLPRMTGYVEFCNRQLEGAALLQRLTETVPAFRDVMQQCQAHPATRGMPLSSYLIKPMQRITKYPLLVGKILEATPNDHPDHGALVEALHEAHRFCELLNEHMRHKENSDRLAWLQHHVQSSDLLVRFDSETNCLGPRRLLHHGILHKVKSGRELIGFLLTDFLLLIQASKSLTGVAGTNVSAASGKQFRFQWNGNCTYRMYRQPLLVCELTARKASTDLVENGTDANRVLKVQTRASQMSLLAPSVNECALWLRRIGDACAVHNKSRAARETMWPADLVAGGQQARGRLLVVVQRAELCPGVASRGRVLLRCRVSLAEQRHDTATVAPHWNADTGDASPPPQSAASVTWDAGMQFHVRNINCDALVLTVQATDPFSPDETLGSARVELAEVARRADRGAGPAVRRVPLDGGRAGHVHLKLDLCMFHD